MKVSRKFGLLLLMFTLLFISSAFGKMLPNNEPVEGLKVEDVPHDDGGGLVLSWKPLPKEKRIIEYRIYRGYTPDSLFYIGKIPVDSKTGVASDTMKYVDQGWTFFVDATSPAKLRHEKGQKKGTKGAEVLYRTMPRDMKVYGPVMDHYRMLAVIPDNEYVYHTKMREFTDVDTTEDGTIDTTSTILAGMKLQQVKYILTKLTVGKDYFYAIQALNMNRTASPLSAIVSGKTTDDPPEKLEEFYAVAVTDKEQMQFEWTLPVFADDQKQFNIYLYDEFDDKHLIFTRPDAYPYTPQTNAIVPYDSIAVRYDAFNPANMKWYRFNIGEQDRQDQETLAKDEPIPAEIITSSMLPVPPVHFTVKDQPNDKGDQMQVYFGYPYFGLSKLVYNDAFTKLTVNYFITDNTMYEVDRLILTINGKTKTEYVLDNKLDFKVNWDYTQPMKIRGTFVCKHKGQEPLPEDYAVTHTFSFDTNMQLVLIDTPPNEQMKEMVDYYYQVYKINHVSDVYRYAKEMSFREREYIDKIAFATVQFRGRPRFDLNEKRLYFSTYLAIVNYEDQYPYYTQALYLDQLHQQDEELKEEIAKLQTELETETDKEEIANIEDRIDLYISYLEDKPEIVKEANQLKTDKERMKLLYTTACKATRSFKYYIRKTDGKGHFIDTPVYTAPNGEQYLFPKQNWFNTDEIITLVAVLLFGALVYFMIRAARKGKRLYIRPIAGIQEIDNAIGRATEMGRPILFVPGLSGISDVATLAGLAILSKVAKKAAEYDTRILVPCRDFIVLPIAQETVKEAHYEAGRPDTYDKNSVFFITQAQFAFVSGVNGIMIREKTATNFYMGMFWAESLLMTETGSMTGAIQIAGTDAVNQLPFFITTCDYTLIGEELYAASAYLSKQPLILGTLKAQDYMKLLIVITVVIGTLLSTVHLTFFMNWFPAK
ncbi:MAG: hypothetical protein JW794_03595 [Candidatus Cloacimonetes bacterium]|nr:hypothetical protein [Candidatus Cloacimonadota bacterium]